jgi:iron(III) transport system substrate-binding protein
MKHTWKKLALTSLSLVGILALSACGGSSDKKDDKAKDGGKSDKLVIYSPNSEGLINATIPAFEEKYGVKVELIQAGTGELFKKLESEASAPVADVIFGGTYTLYDANADLFEKYTSKENNQVIKEYQNKNGYSTPYTLDGSVIVVNPDLTKGMDIKGYKDLLNPELKGKIATADPANSSSAFSQLTNMLIDEGAMIIRTHGIM